MTRTFSIEELESIVEPANLADVLDSLWFGGAVTSYNLDYRGGYVIIEFDDKVEVEELFKEVQNTPRVNTKSKGTVQ